MSREKQIEEMTKDLCQAEFWYVDEDCCDLELDRRKTAESLYNAGYRKQSEGEWKPSPSGSTNVYCSLCGAMSGGGIYCSHCGAKMKGENNE